MKKSEELKLRSKVGNFNSIYGCTDYLINDGPARGTRAFSVKNGRGLTMTVVADRGLDIPYLAFEGQNMGFCSKTGMRAPGFFAEDGARGFLRQFFAGQLTTAGITYAGAPGEDGGEMLGLHGVYNNTPAEHVTAGIVYEGDDAVIRISGSVREARVFGPNVRLDRELFIETENDVVRIHDTVTNLGFEDQSLMLLYHINFGYPMLDAGAKIYLNAGKVVPRTPFAEEGMHNYDEMEEPGIGRDEQCYFHTEVKDAEGFAMIHNPKIGKAAIVSYDPKALPLLCEWKCMRAGDYALGLEPTTSGVLSRAETREAGGLQCIKAGESREFNVKLTYTKDLALIQKYIDAARKKA